MFVDWTRYWCSNNASFSPDYEQNQPLTAPYHRVRSKSNGSMITCFIGTNTYSLVFDAGNRFSLPVDKPLTNGYNPLMQRGKCRPSR